VPFFVRTDPELRRLHGDKRDKLVNNPLNYYAPADKATIAAQLVTPSHVDIGKSKQPQNPLARRIARLKFDNSRMYNTWQGWADRKLAGSVLPENEWQRYEVARAWTVWHVCQVQYMASQVLTDNVGSVAVRGSLPQLRQVCRPTLERPSSTDPAEDVKP
jgi:hypothetical protein